MPQNLPLPLGFEIDQSYRLQHPPFIGRKNLIAFYRNPEKLLKRLFSSADSSESSACEHDVQMILQGVKEGELWALKILDAWGRPLPSGVLTGNIYWLGNYDECLREAYVPPTKSFISQPFPTKYCALSPRAAQSNVDSRFRITIGLCLPLSCTRESIVTAVNRLFNSSSVTGHDLTCSNDPPYGQEGYPFGTIATCTIIAALSALVLLGTTVDLILSSQQVQPDRSIHGSGSPMSISNHLIDKCAKDSQEAPKSPKKTSFRVYSFVPPTPRTVFLAQFSAIRTLRRIFTMKVKHIDDDEMFLFINGIRVLSLFWIVIAHTFLYDTFYTNNIIDAALWTRHIAFQLISSAFFGVDTFFVLSGFLTAIVFVRYVKKERKLSLRLIILYYVHRYIRLTPPLLLVVLVSVNLTPYFGQGPIFPTQIGFESNECRYVYWWTSIFYLQNFIALKQICVPITWYLANDMQFHWLAPLALIPFVLGRKLMPFIVVILFVVVEMVSVSSSLLYYSDMSLDVKDRFTDTPGLNFVKNVYITPWCRISAYAVGLLTGFVVMKCGREYRLNSQKKLIGWSLSTFLILFCLSFTYPDNVRASGIDRSILIAYQSISRTCWALAIGWVLFLCAIHQGGIVNQILSWPFWIPFSRLSYSCYLIHTTVIKTMVYTQKVPIYLQLGPFLSSCVARVFFSYLAAIFVYGLFETPFFLLEKKLFNL